ncbi:MAG TPA: hypothetical protein VHT26_21020 [Trebonia sp.]|nr:hypothetical protein [Trebonia sp.]
MTSNTTMAACKILRIKKPIKSIPPNGRVFLLPVTTLPGLRAVNEIVNGPQAGAQDRRHR